MYSKATEVRDLAFSISTFIQFYIDTYAGVNKVIGIRTTIELLSNFLD